ncbi:MAG: MiaB/RimO family radical SAM methylthiotransferase [bacterium]|nr:MiaB/RimO family radical SAM methylthiotransferase [bacterium]
MKYFIITFGCQANKADSERITTILNSRGYQKTSDENEADIIVINACSVRQSAVDRVYSKIHEFSNKKIILAGCLLEKDKQKLKDKVREIWHPDEYFDFIPVASNPSSAYVPIMTGCNNFCAYCAVPFTRGRERSRPAAQIIKEVKNLVKKNYKEIWLLGQNVNSYLSRQMNFPKLLKIINTIPGKFSLRFLSSHPKDFSDELIGVISQCEKISKEIHLPVQSGDNEILKKMNRGYTAENYKNLVKKIRKEIPTATISTDVIVGFPGETKKQFKNTVTLFKEVKFKSAYIARYSPRTGTIASKLKDSVKTEEKKRRWNELNNLFKKIKTSRKNEHP